MLGLKKYLPFAARFGSFFLSKGVQVTASRNFNASRPCQRSLPLQWKSFFNAYTAWFNYPQYLNPKFYEVNPGLLYYRPLKNRPLKCYLNELQPSQCLLGKLGGGAHFIEVDYITDDFIVRGRLGKYLKRDEMFAQHAKECLARLDKDGGLENTFFINYTGHQAPVSSVLYELGIDCVWQLKKEHFPSFSGRIIEQLHDWPGRSAFKKTKPILSSFGLILEPNHGFSSIGAASLPSQGVLKNFGIKKVVVLTEYPFSVSNSIYRYDPQHFKDDPEFASYLTRLSRSYELQIVGTEPGEVRFQPRI